ncbi:MAG: putative quinol monooxygenase [Cyanobacteria bacterium P01_H01_bin.74]
MNKLTIVANIKVNPEKIDFVKTELEKLIPITQAEEGCLQYDLHQDNENLAHFMFYENWTNRELWQIHMNNQHLKDYMEATEGMIEEFTLNEMTQITS